MARLPQEFGPYTSCYNRLFAGVGLGGATRYDKLAADYLAFFQLASIRLWLRVNQSTP